ASPPGAPELRAELGIGRLERPGAPGVEELAAGRLRDRVERLRVGRHRDRLLERSETPTQCAARRPECDGIDGDPGLLRALRALARLEVAACLLAVREEYDRDRAARRARRDRVRDRLQARGGDGLLPQLDGSLEGVADRRAAEAREGPDLVERLAHELVIGRGRSSHLRLA